MAVGTTHGWPRFVRGEGKAAEQVDADFLGLVGSAAATRGAHPLRNRQPSFARRRGMGWPASSEGRGVSAVRQAARGEARGFSGMAATMPPRGALSRNGPFAQPILSNALAKDRRSSTAAAVLRQRSRGKAVAPAPVGLPGSKMNRRQVERSALQAEHPLRIESVQSEMEAPSKSESGLAHKLEPDPKAELERSEPKQLPGSDQAEAVMVQERSPGYEDESSAADSAPSSPSGSNATSTSEVLSAQTRADLFGSTFHKQRNNPRIQARERIQTQLEVIATVETGVTATQRIQVELTRGETANEGEELSAKVISVEVSSEKSTAAIPFRSYKGPISGVLKLGETSVDFHAGECKSSKLVCPSPGLNVIKLAGERQKLEERNFLVNPHEYSGCTTRQCIERQRVTLVDLATKTAAEVRIREGWDAKLTVQLRKATEIELTRQDGTEALLKAERGTKYSALNAAIIRAKASRVEAALIARAAKKLNTLEVAKPCDLATLKKILKWKNVTEGSGGPIIEQCELEGCEVGASREGEVCDIEAGAVQEALHACALAPQDGSIELDKWLFKQLSESIILGEKENALYKSGKHVIFSNPNRNQAPGSLCNYLLRLGKPEAAAAIMSLIAHTEKKYSKHVSAVQINVHLDGKSCHKQHHDIYSIAQREGAGRDCTCSFNEMVGTACYTVGSSRRVMMRVAPKKHRKKCCEDCSGYSKKQWLHSGDIMYFNKPWNLSWTHGIPHHDYDADGDIGPRMSIALLCAEGDFKVPFVESAFKIPGVGLVINGGGSGGGQCALNG